jgi:hypothetical protein
MKLSERADEVHLLFPHVMESSFLLEVRVSWSSNRDSESARQWLSTVRMHDSVWTEDNMMGRIMFLLGNKKRVYAGFSVINWTFSSAQLINKVNLLRLF